ncbi:Gfo/Idh/MocA family oxidoreductase [Lentisphaerota bacterium ZTH]|nr:Gfo/Idh/MocA family oxidoreductase [Lentisphaerota bacterium]WET05550.1 Gfo/Idh/MocA family oxidoreductase [Lentisphaerota bacterium ZTH]
MFKLAIIGLDTSHTPKFVDFIQGENKLTDKLRVVKAMRFPSAFQSEAGQDERQAAIEKLGVKVSTDFAETVAGVDGLLLEINDPALHLEYFSKAAELGLPIFLDKPLADNIENAREIVRLKQEHNLNVWTSSSLRFTSEIKECTTKVSNPVLANTYGPLDSNDAGNPVVWYGVHSFEMLMTIMGQGAESVKATKDERGVVAIVNYKDGRRGIVELNSEAFIYGGRAQSADSAFSFVVDSSITSVVYANLMQAIEDFMLSGIVPITLEESFEVQAMLEATVQSLQSGEAAAAPSL